MAENDCIWKAHTLHEVMKLGTRLLNFDEGQDYQNQ